MKKKDCWEECRTQVPIDCAECVGCIREQRDEALAEIERLRNRNKDLLYGKGSSITGQEAGEFRAGIERLKKRIKKQTERMKQSPTAVVSAMVDILKNQMECDHPIGCFNEQIEACAFCDALAEIERLRKEADENYEAGREAGVEDGYDRGCDASSAEFEIVIAEATAEIERLKNKISDAINLLDTYMGDTDLENDETELYLAFKLLAGDEP